MENNAPFSSVWGNVTHVKKDPGNKGCILVTVAGQVLRLQRSTDDGMEEIGLLRLTKRNRRIFLIFWEDKAEGRHRVLAGWNNPDSRTVRILQSHITGSELRELIVEYDPTWKGNH